MNNGPSDLDLNIENYSFTDLINLFKITAALGPADINKARKVHLAMEKQDISKEIKTTFAKGFILVSLVKSHRIYKSITDSFHIPDITHDEDILSRIHRDGNIDECILMLTNSTNGDIDMMPTVKKLYPVPKIQSKPQTETPHPQDPCSPPRFINVFDNQIVKGNVNSMRREIQRTNVHINSCFRDRYYDSNPSDFRYQLPNGTFQHVLSMKLASVEIPNSWFMFSHLKGNNKFIVEATHCSKCSVNHVVVPDGNYDRESLVTYLNTKYFADSGEEKSPLRFIRMCIEPLSNRTKFELTECAPADFVFSLHFTEDDTENMLETMGWVLGFRLARYIKIQDAIQSEGLFDGAIDRYIYLSINDYQYSQNSTNIVCFDKMAITDNILAKIPLLNGKFSLTIDENDSNPLIKIRQYKGPVNISRLDIKLLDRFGNIINLNFMDWSFSLELEMLYDNVLCN